MVRALSPDMSRHNIATRKADKDYLRILGVPIPGAKVKKACRLLGPRPTPKTIYRRCSCGESAHDAYVPGYVYVCRNCGVERDYKVRCNCAACKRERTAR